MRNDEDFYGSGHIEFGGLRALFITNECAGLGHLRRTINLARAVTENDPEATALVTGSAALGSFVLPDRVDTVKLPVFRREADGTLYAATLGVDMPRIESMRADILGSAAAHSIPMSSSSTRRRSASATNWSSCSSSCASEAGAHRAGAATSRTSRSGLAAWAEADTVAAVERFWTTWSSTARPTPRRCVELPRRCRAAGTVSNVGFVGNKPATTHLTICRRIPPRDASAAAATVGPIEAVLDADQYQRCHTRS